MSKDKKSCDLKEWLEIFYNSGLLLERCKEFIERLLSLLKEHKLLSVFSTTLPALLKPIMQQDLDITLLERWTKLWDETGKTYPECKIGLRLLKAGSNYLLSSPRDESAFIKLRVEERTLIKDLLELSDEKDS